MLGIVREEIIGPCRLILGDCMEVLPLIGKVDAVVTDPPYGVSHKPGSGKQSKIIGGIAGDESPPKLAWMSECEAIIWGGNNFCDQLPRSTGWLVWDKTHAETCRHSQAELAWTNVVRTIRWHRQAYHGFMRQRDGWFHQHQKPVELMQWCVQFTSGRIVLDPYMGSGTTGLACIRESRNFVGIDIDEHNFDIAVTRIRRAWQDKQSEIKFDEPPKRRQLSLTDE